MVWLTHDLRPGPVVDETVASRRARAVLGFLPPGDDDERDANGEG